MAYPTYSTNMTPAETEAYWTAYFLANPINIPSPTGGYDFGNLNIPLTDNFANGSGLNTTNINSAEFAQYVINQKSWKIERGDFSDLPIFTEALATLSEQEKITFYKTKTKELEQWAYSIQFKAEAVARDLGYSIKSSNTLQAIKGTIVGVASAFIPVIGLVYGVLGELKNITGLSQDKNEREALTGKLENIQKAADVLTSLYSKYDKLIKDLEAKIKTEATNADNTDTTNSRSTTTPVKTATKWIITGVVVVILLFMFFRKK
jgi:hypothetical protein